MQCIIYRVHRQRPRGLEPMKRCWIWLARTRGPRLAACEKLVEDWGPGLADGTNVPKQRHSFRQMVRETIGFVNVLHSTEY